MPRPLVFPDAPGASGARWYDSATGEFTRPDPDLAQTDQAYVYSGDDPVNQTDPSGNCTDFNISCTFRNEQWVQDATGTGTAGYPLSNKKAAAFLVDNNFSKSDASSYVSSFAGQITINLTTQLPLPIFRYYSGSGKQGYSFADTYFPTACDARSAYHLQPPWTQNTARYVAQVAPNGDFSQAPLVLEGHVTNGDPDVLQYIAFDPGEFVYGRGVQTDSGTYPPPPPFSVSVGIPGLPPGDD